MDAVSRAACQLHPELHPTCVTKVIEAGISTVAHVEDILRLPMKKALEDKQEERMNTSYKLIPVKYSKWVDIDNPTVTLLQTLCRTSKDIRCNAAHFYIYIQKNLLYIVERRLFLCRIWWLAALTEMPLWCTGNEIDSKNLTLCTISIITVCSFIISSFTFSLASLCKLLMELLISSVWCCEVKFGEGASGMIPWCAIPNWYALIQSILKVNLSLISSKSFGVVK